MAEQRKMPEEEGLDHSLKLLREGYQFIRNRSDRFESNVFKTKILAQPAICLIGKEAAELFYDNDKFRRSDAAPKRVQKTLFGQGGVQSLDGKEHRHRKGMFMALMTNTGMKEISSITQEQLEHDVKRWEKEEQIVLYEEAKKLLTVVACKWTGVPLPKEEIVERAEQLGHMFESAAAFGPNHWKGRKARSDAEDWLIEIVQKVRNESLQVESDRALYAFSWHRDLDGKQLDEKIVAVELLNLLRPIVAISVYICFMTLAIHQYPNEIERLQTDNEDYSKWFIQEVRRFYPFFPFAAARVKKDFTWNGFSFEDGTLTLLDLYGTNHHPEIWNNPNHFQPERFKGWEGSPFDFIPQGGGDYNVNHRCAGEWITLEILKVCLRYFIDELAYDVPKQNLSYSMVKMPSLPESKMLLRNIRCIDMNKSS